nr:uncharacterized protein LOC117279964 [Nicotiana tomentosiformis]
MSKYCGKYHPVIKKPGKGASHTWKQLCKIKDKGKKIDRDIKLREVFINGEWHEENTGLIWPDAVKIALLNVNLELYPGKPDIPIWSPDSRGEFTISSAWGIFRQRRGISTTDSKIWHRAVPFKMAFPTWRAIYGRLPTDERVARMGFALEYSVVTTATFMVEDQSVKHNCFFYYQVKQKFGQLQMEMTWERLQSIFDQPINHRMYKMVRWSKPPPTYFKINSDGSCVEGNCGVGGIIRDCNRVFIMEYSIYLGPGTSNWAKGQAMLFGLQQCLVRGFDKIEVEADSKVLVSAVNEESENTSNYRQNQENRA